MSKTNAVEDLEDVKMTATLSYLERLKEKCGNVTDYRAAKLLNIKQATISCWKTRGSQMEDATAIKLAQLIDLPANFVVADIHLDTAKNEEETAFWQSIKSANISHSATK